MGAFLMLFGFFGGMGFCGLGLVIALSDVKLPLVDVCDWDVLLHVVGFLFPFSAAKTNTTETYFLRMYVCQWIDYPVDKALDNWVLEYYGTYLVIRIYVYPSG